MPLITMNVMNAFGERQHPEKFIPLLIGKLQRGEKVTLHAYKGAARAGSRFYIHARNIAAAVLFVLTHGKHGEKYNVQGEAELDNLEVRALIARPAPAVANRPSRLAFFGRWRNSWPRSSA